MKIRFLVDAQLPPALADRLGERGHRAEHVNTLGLGAASDLEIWARAKSIGAVLMTKDEDFCALAKRDRETRVVWLRIGNATNAALWRILEPAMPQIESALAANETLIEVGG